VQTSFDETTIKLLVKDNGQGFPPDLLAHAFEPYVTTKAHGTGLGLAIVKKMIEEHHGQIKIENNATGGACIGIELPIEKAKVAINNADLSSKPKASIKNPPVRKTVTKQSTAKQNVTKQV
jgi:signal transduction histidine kinase